MTLVVTLSCSRKASAMSARVASCAGDLAHYLDDVVDLASVRRRQSNASLSPPGRSIPDPKLPLACDLANIGPKRLTAQARPRSSPGS